MKLFLHYLRSKALKIGAFLLFALLFLVSFRLYHLPLAAVWYPSALCAALGLVIWYLCTIDSDGVAYMAPFVDSERPTIFRTLLRRPQPDEKFRPPEYDSPNRRRQR